MKRFDLSRMNVTQLVERFTAIALEQDRALTVDDIARFNRLYDLMKEVADELARRPGDQRRALVPLYTSPNMQVRLKAAKATLAVSPAEARAMLEAIVDSHWFPQAGDAGMTLLALDDGTYVPR